MLTDYLQSGLLLFTGRPVGQPVYCYNKLRLRLRVNIMQSETLNKHQSISILISEEWIWLDCLLLWNTIEPTFVTAPNSAGALSFGLSGPGEINHWQTSYCWRISVFSLMFGFVYLCSGWSVKTKILGLSITDVVTPNPCIRITNEFIMHNTGYKIILSITRYVGLTEKKYI